MTASLIPTPVMQFLDADGNPLVGGKVYTYAAGTSTPLATYTDYGGATPNANPVILNSRGEASIWFGTAAYKLELYTAANVLIWTADNVSASTPVVYGTGVAAALAINVGTAGSILVNGGALVGTTLSASGTATMAAINASGTVAMAGAATVGTTLGVTGVATFGVANTTPASIKLLNSAAGTSSILFRNASDAGTNASINVDNATGILGITATYGLSVTGTLGVTGTSTMAAINASGNVTVTRSGSVAQFALNSASGTALNLDDNMVNGQWLVNANVYAATFSIYNVDRGSHDISIANATGAVTIPGTLGVTGVTTIGSVSSGIALAVTSSAATYTGSFINSAATSAGLLIKAGSTSGHEVLDVQSYNATSLLKVVASGAVTIPGTLNVTGKITTTAAGADPSSSVIGVKVLTGIDISAGSSTSLTYLMAFINGNGTVGNINVNGSATAFATSSDYRLKENVQPMTGALATVAALKPVTFKWKTDGSDGQGFIAHELQAVLPDAVTGEKDATAMQQYEISPAIPATFDEEGNELTAAVEAVMGEREVPRYQGVDTSFLVATLTAAINELAADFQSYKSSHP